MRVVVQFAREDIHILSLSDFIQVSLLWTPYTPGTWAGYSYDAVKSRHIGIAASRTVDGIYCLGKVTLIHLPMNVVQVPMHNILRYLHSPFFINHFGIETPKYLFAREQLDVIMGVNRYVFFFLKSFELKIT